MATPIQADILIDNVLLKLNLSRKDPANCYNNLSLINDELDKINTQKTIDTKTTGTINERLVKFALDGFVKDSWYPLTFKKFQWLGDFGVFGYPVNAIISVKSFTAKERLLASGTGSFLAPTIGWGRFNDEKEFSYKRMRNYEYRGFLAIYMPEQTIQKLTDEAKNVLNFNKKPLIRDIKNFGADLSQARITKSKPHINMLDFSTF